MLTSLAQTAPPAPKPTVVSAGEELSGLDLALLRPALGIRDWLLEAGARDDKQNVMLAGLAERLNRLGIPVERITTAIEALHSEYSGVGRMWTREQGSSLRLFDHDERDSIYERSPFAYVHRTGEWLILDLQETPDDAFGIVPELKEAGYRHYVCIPIVFTNGSHNGITFATRGWFEDQHLAILRFVVPSLAAAMEMRAVNQRLDNVLRIYVGDEPHRAILSGAIRRGQVTRIRSAILFADMRSYTQISSILQPEAAVELLNTFFDCLVPPIEAEGGEILKYLGDGLLAIFRDKGDDTGGTAQSALTAAIAGLVKLAEANRSGAFPVKVEAGIALHHGEAAYGNVGSGVRLDFTVIGRDVNLASRIAQMNKVLGEPLLMSRAFADHLWGDPEPLGAHDLDGFDERIQIYRLRQTDGTGSSSGSTSLADGASDRGAA
ncbi:MAG TPA: adenylate/guanylate cyclase domain-containing protein [Enterovirga sp.]|nr:adenylate/guanylate cyclase domain-containing protein [Enterovirga sp.]